MYEHKLTFKFFLGASLASLFLCLNSSTVLATDLEISGNGSQSVSSTEVDTHTSQSVVSTNEASITNNVNSEANTGGNTVTGNSGNGVIGTGAVTNTTQIDNNANTSSVTNPSCCTGATSAQITGNGVGTANAIDVNTSHTTVVTTTNNATILNNIYSYGNTGNNSASHNNGSVQIETGNVIVNTTVTNSSINNSAIITSTQGTDPINISISGNGAGSVNKAQFSNAVSTRISVVNKAFLSNNIQSIGNTGGNSAIANTGNGSIKTGSVSLNTVVNNTGINSSIVRSSNCCSKPSDPDNPGTGGVTQPGNGNTSGTSSSSSNGIGGGEVLAAAVGAVLPATGSNMTLWAGVFNVFMLLMGLYLRNRAGRSPCILTFEFVW